MDKEFGLSQADHEWRAEKEPVLSGIKEYMSNEGEKITLQWHKVEPKLTDSDQQANTNKALLFLPGVALEAGNKSVIGSTQHFADAARMPAYSISTRLESPVAENSQAIQAEAIRQFAIEHRLHEIILVGNSQGANKAIDTAFELEQSDADIIIDGLILTQPAGLYEQDGADLTKRFFKDAMIKTPPAVLRKVSVKSPKAAIARMGKSIQLGKDVASGIAKELYASPREFPKRLVREQNEAAAVNVHAADIAVPIVIVLGAQDVAFDSKRLIPTDKENPEHDAHDKTLRSQQMRNEAMKEIFPNSAAIRVLEGEKDSVHGMHYLRGEQVAKTSIAMLQRMKRERDREVKE